MAEVKRIAKWNEHFDKIMVDLAYHETLIGNRPTTSFSKQGWKKIVGGFYSKTGKFYDKQQIKNQLAQLKSKWTAWNKVLTDASGFGWDPIKKTITADDETWANYTKVNPNAEKFRSATFPMFEELNVIFSDTVATGCEAFAPQLEESDEEITPLGCNDFVPSTPINEQCSNFESVFTFESTRKEKVVENKKRRIYDKNARYSKKESRSSEITESLKMLVEINKAKMLSTISSVNNETNTMSITTCIKTIQEMGITISNKSMNKAIELFQSIGWREAFMAMNQEQRMGWLECLGQE